MGFKLISLIIFLLIIAGRNNNYSRDFKDKSLQ